MEPIPKRRRLAYDYNEEAHDYDQHEEARFDSRYRLKSKLESLFDKYGRDFSGVGDEIDLRTGAIVVNNGHLSTLQDEVDAGFEDEDEYFQGGDELDLEEIGEDIDIDGASDEADEGEDPAQEGPEYDYDSESDLSVLNGAEEDELEDEGGIIDLENEEGLVPEGDDQGISTHLG